MADGMYRSKQRALMAARQIIGTLAEPERSLVTERLRVDVKAPKCRLR